MLEKNFYKSSKNEKKYLLVAFVINIIVINIFLFIGTQSSLINDSISDDSYSQIIAILTSMLLLSTIVIVFFQWIIKNLFLSLYLSRKRDNINLRLIGINYMQLFKLYFKEYLIVNCITIPIGLIISIISCYILSIFLKIPNISFKLWVFILGTLIHFIIITISLVNLFKKLSKTDLVTQLRERTDVSFNVKFTKTDLILSIISIFLFILPTIIENITSEVKVIYLAKLFYILASILSINTIFKIVFKLLIYISKKFNFAKILIASNICLGDLKKNLNSCIIIVISVVFFLGLQYLFTTVRQNSFFVADNNVKYSARLYKENGFFTEEELSNLQIDKDRAFFTIAFKVPTYGRIIGVDEKFFNEYENIVIDNDKGVSFEKFDNKDYNKIIMPSIIMNNSNLNKDLSLNILNDNYNFNVLSGYAFNIFDTYNSFVSKAYLENILNLNDKYNMIFLKESINISNLPKNIVYETKNDLLNTTRDEVVKSTEIIEIFSLIILLCGTISFINNSAMNSRNSKETISKMRAMGILNNDIKIIYFISAILPIIIAFIFIYPLALILTNIAGNIMLDSYHMSFGIKTIPFLFLELFFIITIFNIVCQFIFIREILKTNKYIDLLRSKN